MINFGEIELRTQDVENLVSHVFGPEGYLYNSDMAALAQTLKKVWAEKKQVIQEAVSKGMNGQKIDWSAIQDMVKMITSEAKGNANLDAFIRVFGREIASISANPDFR